MTDIDCRDVVELVTDYLEKALDADTVAVMEAHLAICEGCDAYVEQIRRTIAALGYLPLDSLSDEAVNTLAAAFRDVRAV